MALQHLPRPWLLAALAEVPMTLLAQEDDERPTYAGGTTCCHGPKRGVGA